MTLPHPASVSHAAMVDQVRSAAADTGSCGCPDGTDSWFDRSVCPEPCGGAHEICRDCGRPRGGCPLDTQVSTSDLYARCEQVLTDHAPAIGADGSATCTTCRTGAETPAPAPWPCPAASLAAAIANPL